MLSFEVLLILGACGFYLYDSVMLLYTNELIFIRTGNHWRYVYPNNSYQLLGKNPYIPNPLTPYNPIFRVVYWVNPEKGRIGSNNMEESLEQFMNALMQLKYMVLTLLALFFAALPLVLFLYGSGPQLLWLFLLIYIDICVMLTLVYIRKDIFGLSNKRYCVLLFESIACAPFALNIVRKLCLYRSLSSDPIQFAKRSFGQKVFHSMIDVICWRIGEQLELTEEDTSRYSSLRTYQVKLEEMKS